MNDVLESALYNPGRIDNKVECPAAARVAILLIHSRKVCGLLSMRMLSTLPHNDPVNRCRCNVESACSSDSLAYMYVARNQTHLHMRQRRVLFTADIRTVASMENGKDECC